MRWGITLIVVSASLLSGTAQSAGQLDLERGERLYKLCAGCHGFAAQGNELVKAPALAGQESWYLRRQVDNFLSGIRGSGSDDAAAQSMAVMSKSLTSDEQVDDIVAYIGTLPSKFPASTSGDAARGAGLYAPCAACHGDNAQGNPALNAPALVHLSPWYQIAQLQKFKNGMRGRHPQDIFGQQMAPMAAVLADESAMADVAAFISSIQQ